MSALRGEGRRVLLAIVAAASLGCNGGAGYGTAPAPRPVPGQWNFGDPVGDTTGAGGVRWDLNGASIERDSVSITVQLDFLQPLILPVAGDPAAMVGIVELDVDQDAATGVRSAVDIFRGDSGTGIGADYRVLFTGYTADSTVAVVDARGLEVGRVKVLVHTRRLQVRVPLAMIGGGDGVLNAAALVGTVGIPSDYIPNAGHLTAGPQ